MASFLRAHIGPVAATILHNDGEAEVTAVFERCFYVSAPSGYVCVGVDGLGCGPLNVLLPSLPAVPDWPSLGITREAKGAVAYGNLHVGDRFLVPLTLAQIWQPPPWQPSTPVPLRRSLAALASAAAPLCPAEGLSRLVFGRSERADRTARAATDTVAMLRQSLQASWSDETVRPELTRSATLLLGLGPGLTPSGDDLLGGVFLALSALNRIDLRDALWGALEPELDLLTVGISAAHLAAAADGMGAESVHAALNAVLAADLPAFPAHLSALGAIGHSSGFDTLAGIVIALEASLIH